MIEEYINQYGPIVMGLFWIISIIKRKDASYTLVTLLILSFVACSQNFSFSYREIHQGIQLALGALTVVTIARRKQVLKLNAFFLIFLLFIGGSYIANPIDEDAQNALLNIVTMMVMLNFMHLYIKDRNQYFGITRFIVNLALIQSIFGLAEAVIGNVDRIEGTMANPNYLGLFLGITFCLAVHDAKERHQYLGAAVIFVGLLLTGSRAALLMPLIYGAWIAFTQGWWLRVAAPAVVAVIVIPILMQNDVLRFGGEQAAASDAERLIFARIAGEMAADHPATGVGWGRFPTEFSNYATRAERVVIDVGVEIDPYSQERRVTHNDFLRVLAELGWGAFGFFMISCVYILRQAWIVSKKRDKYALPIILGLLVFSFTHNNLNSLVFWFYFVLPLFLNYPKISEK
jgi:hypothetical protein